MRLDIRNWKYNGRKLANPFIILWKLLLIIPLWICIILTGIMFALFERDFSRIRSTINACIYS